MQRLAVKLDVVYHFGTIVDCLSDPCLDWTHPMRILLYEAIPVACPVQLNAGLVDTSSVRIQQICW